MEIVIKKNDNNEKLYFAIVDGEYIDITKDVKLIIVDAMIDKLTPRSDIEAFTIGYTSGNGLYLISFKNKKRFKKVLDQHFIKIC
jgi:hypothetical protein